MWLKADLHVHAHPSDRGLPDLEPEALARVAAEQGLDVLAVTDHDTVEFVEDVAEACAALDIHVVPGIEVTTSRGHLLCYAPGPDGLAQLRSLVARGGIGPDEHPDCDQLLSIIESATCQTTGASFRSCFITVAAHAAKDRSLLAGSDSATSIDQLKRVARLDAVELTEHDRADQWASQGIRSSELVKPILMSSDAHELEAVGSRFTWIYLHGGVTTSALRQALASPEVSLRRGGEQPALPNFYLTRLRVEGPGGLHDGLDLALHPRLNAIIGPPSVGKSLVVDILREVFGDRCPIEEIALMTDRRVDATLPEGTVITVDAMVDGESIELRREVGGAATMSFPKLPIVFSQGELTRRSMAAHPELELIDVHAVSLEDASTRHDRVATTIRSEVGAAIEFAQGIKRCSDTISNPVDGLEAVNERLELLTPAKDVAERLQQLRAAESWRHRTLTTLEPHLELTVELPALPSPPTHVEGHEDVARWTKDDAVETLIAELRGDLRRLSETYQARANTLLGPDNTLTAALEETESQLHSALQEGEEAREDESSAVLSRLRALHERRVELEELVRERDRLATDLAAVMDSVRDHLRELAEASQDVLEARKQACRAVNEHIRGFFCHVTQDDHGQRYELVRALRTSLREPTLLEYCSDFDPVQLVQDVVDALAAGLDRAEGDEDTTHYRCVTKILASEDWDTLSELVCSRSAERLHIKQTLDSGDPVPFESMTEGTRALAIKEISFAASDRPVVTDQPEDSVPPRAVYAELVPTLREQRAGRQFIVVSHDANIVVGADADNIIVLGGDQGVPVTGNLHDTEISRAALENLEGGEEAFELRKRRYSNWVADGGSRQRDGR